MGYCHCVGRFTHPEDHGGRLPDPWREDFLDDEALANVLQLILHPKLECAALFAWGHSEGELSPNEQLADHALSWLRNEGMDPMPGPRLLCTQGAFGRLIREAEIPEDCGVIFAPHRPEAFETAPEFAERLSDLLFAVNRALPPIYLVAAEPQRDRAAEALRSAGFHVDKAAVERESWYVATDPQLQVRSPRLHRAATAAVKVAPSLSQTMASRFFQGGATVRRLQALGGRTTERGMAPATQLDFDDCFISYARKNRECAQRIEAGLRAAGVEVFRDEAIQGGERWQQQIVGPDGLIESTNRFVLLCSRASLQSDAVTNELAAAFRRQDREGCLRVIPVDLDGFVINDACANEFRERLLELQVITFSRPGSCEDGLRRLLAALSVVDVTDDPADDDPPDSGNGNQTKTQ